MTATTWRLDPAHTDIAFSAKHMMITTVRGSFGDVDGTLQIDEGDAPSASGEIRVKTASVNTSFAARDEHLRSADFFDAATYPEIDVDNSFDRPADTSSSRPFECPKDKAAAASDPIGNRCCQVDPGWKPGGAEFRVLHGFNAAWVALGIKIMANTFLTLLGATLASQLSRKPSSG